MTQEEAIELLRSEKEVIALNEGAYVLFLGLGLSLLYQGVDVAKVVKGYGNDESATGEKS